MTAAEDQRRYRTAYSSIPLIVEIRRKTSQPWPLRPIPDAGKNSPRWCKTVQRPGNGRPDTGQGRNSAVAAASNISMPEAIDEILRGRPSPRRKTCGPYPPAARAGRSRTLDDRAAFAAGGGATAWRRIQRGGGSRSMFATLILHEPHAKLAALPPYGVAEAARFAVLGQEQGEDVRQCVRAGSRNPCSLIRRVPHNAGNPAAAFQHDPCRLASGRAFLLAEITPQVSGQSALHDRAGMRHARGCRGSGRSRIVGVVAPSPPLGCVT